MYNCKCCCKLKGFAGIHKKGLRGGWEHNTHFNRCEVVGQALVSLELPHQLSLQSSLGEVHHGLNKKEHLMIIIQLYTHAHMWVYVGCTQAIAQSILGTIIIQRYILLQW